MIDSVIIIIVYTTYLIRTKNKPLKRTLRERWPGQLRSLKYVRMSFIGQYHIMTIQLGRRRHWRSHSFWFWWRWQCAIQPKESSLGMGWKGISFISSHHQPSQVFYLIIAHPILVIQAAWAQHWISVWNMWWAYLSRPQSIPTTLLSEYSV